MKLVIFALMIPFITFSGAKGATAPGVSGYWKVVSHSGESWYANESDIIGKKQYFYKGYASGVFYQCDYAGQSYTYSSYKIREFLANKEFKLFKTLKEFNENYNKTIFVHRITCNGKKLNQRKVLYPFVTILPNRTKAFYLFEGGIYTLVHDQ